MRRTGAGGKPARHGLARVLSKRGLCSRSEAERRVREGRVRVDGRVIRDPEFPMSPDAGGIDVDGVALGASRHRYLMLNKPRGLVTSTRDERGRDTVYACFGDQPMGWIAPVGRLDKASEGLLLFTSDPAWAARITEAHDGPHKTYHVQVDCVPDEAMLAALVAGVEVDGVQLSALQVRLLRHGGRNAWLEFVLDEGRNRHIRRLLEAFVIAVLRLVRVAIGPLALGALGKGQWRELDAAEVAALAQPSTPA